MRKFSIVRASPVHARFPTEPSYPQILLASGAGKTNTSIAKRMALTGITVGKWRKRNRELGLDSLPDELRPGRPRTDVVHKMAEVINRALQARPLDGSTQRSDRTLHAGCRPSRCNLTGRNPTASRKPVGYRALNRFVLCGEGS
jgi:putative transposase